MALFGITAKEWRMKNPDKEGKIRYYADVNELVCLSNLENVNSIYINEGLSQKYRLIKLNEIAISQMEILTRDNLKLIENIQDKGIKVRYENENLWMTQKSIAELFDVEQPTIAKHLINIYNDNELDKESTYSKMELVQLEGNRKVKRNLKYYNLDAIISVGYRVNSIRATQFRR